MTGKRMINVDRNTSFISLVMAGLALLAVYGALFPIPASLAFIRFLALGGFFLLCVCLTIGPLAVIQPSAFCPLIAQRRAIGLACFIFAIGHFLLAFWLQYGLQIGALLGWPMLVATIGLALFIILAITSADWAIKSLPNWKNVQRLAYLAFAASLMHFILKANGLFVKVGDATFVNAAEIALIGFGIIVVALQVIGFLMIRGRKVQAGAVCKEN